MRDCRRAPNFSEYEDRHVSLIRHLLQHAGDVLYRVSISISPCIREPCGREQNPSLPRVGRPELGHRDADLEFLPRNGGASDLAGQPSGGTQEGVVRVAHSVPRICEFFGMRFGGEEAVFALDGVQLEGDIGARARRLVAEWCAERPTELREAWAHASRG